MKTHVSLRVSDLKSSAAFYQKLGFAIKREVKLAKFSTDLVFLEASPNFELELVYNWDNNRKPELKDGYLHLGLEVKNMESFLQELKAKGIEPLCPVNILPGGGKMCFVVDPDGYQVELMEHARK